VITIGRLAVGGAELRLLQVVRSIQERRLPVQCTVFVVSGERGPLDADFLAAGAAVVFGRPGLRGLRPLWSLCRRLRPQVLHVNAEMAAGFYGLAGLAAGVPLRVAHLHSMARRRGLAEWLKELVYGLATNLFCLGIIGVSTGSRAGRLILRPWRTVYNGITPPTDEELGRTPLPRRYGTDRVRIAVLGRIQREKNVDRAIRIFAAFRRSAPSAELHIIGPYVDVRPESLEAEARSAGVADAVHFHGSVASPFEYLTHASLLLLTSSVEGLPGVVLEALACGTPVVSSDVPGAVEIADRTAGVVCLSLAESDERWAAAMTASLATSRQAVRSAFRSSTFMTDRFVRELLGLWKVPP
jgi:glycosyltransferase involved in cell wall biosynthesis